MDGERQMLLEELIQDLEFQCPGVTLNENLGETTYEVIETTTTASQEMSVDNTTASEVMTVDATSLPEHNFIKKLITGKTGKKKGKTTISYMLLMGTHIYKHRNDYKDNHFFSCTDCLKYDKTVNAVAHFVYGETEDEDKYILQYAPPLDESK